MSAIRWCAILIGLSACGYQAPAQTNLAAQGYQTDLAACRDAAHSSVNKQNAKRALDWFSSPVRRWGQIGDATQSCMADKGYGRVRWCTEAELRDGRRSGGMVVTSSGVQCSDPPSPERRKPI